MSIDDRLERFAASWIRELVPYKVEDPSDRVKLDAMENPYSIPAELRERWNNVLNAVEPNRYPDAGASDLKRSLLDSHRLPADVHVTLGNGSDELIHLLCLAFARAKNACVLCPEPTFVVYGITAQALGMNYIGVPLNARDFSLDLDAMLEAIAKHEPALVFLASPNNPTANRLDEDTLEAICAHAPGLVVLDEAYYRFVGHSRVAETRVIENLVILQTLSKIGLAGLRVGALFGLDPWIDIIDRLRMPYNISSLSQAGAKFAIEHESAFQKQIDAIIDERETVFDALKRLDGVTPWPSETNFILFRTPNGRGNQVFEYLKERRVLVKNLSGAHPLLKDCLRVTVGKPDENQLFIAALADSM